MRHNIEKGREVPLAHVVIILLGKFKGDTGRQNHLKAIVNKTESKLKIG